MSPKLTYKGRTATLSVGKTSLKAVNKSPRAAYFDLVNQMVTLASEDKRNALHTSGGFDLVLKAYRADEAGEIPRPTGKKVVKENFDVE